MARPTKQGIDYFPLDVQFDDKVELFIAETGAEGLGVLITIWQLIYQNEGYYIAAGDDISLLVRRRIMSEIDVINSAIESAVFRGVFDKSLYDTHKILTSVAIQKRYFIGAKQKKSVSIVENYICSGVTMSGNVVFITGNATKVEVEVKEDVKEEVEEKVKEEESNPATDKPKRLKKAVKKEPPVSGPTWEKYINAYYLRYGTDPLRNAMVNGQMARFCKQVSLEEAPHIAAYYVTHNDQFYVKQSHPVGLLLKDFQKLRTEWITGRQVTSGIARQVDNSQTNQSAAQEAIRIMNERDNNA